MGSPLRLGVNIDHVATVRNARGGLLPDPVRAAKLAIAAGADGITAHLREDRRHIRDDDIARLKAEIDKPLNFEMAATDEMVGIALKTKPHACCLVPEKRSERTTEGGLDAAGQQAALKPVVACAQACRHSRLAVHCRAAQPDRSGGGARRRHRRDSHRRLVRCSGRGEGGAGRSRMEADRRRRGAWRPASALKCMPGTASIMPAPRKSRRCRRSSNSISATSSLARRSSRACRRR